MHCSTWHRTSRARSGSSSSTAADGGTDLSAVEAVAGDAALAHVEEKLDQLQRAQQQFRSLEQPLDKAIASLMEERDALRSEIEDLRRSQMASQLDRFIADAQTIDGVRLVTGRVDGADMDDLQALGQTLRDRLGEGAVGVLGSVPPEDEKVYVVATVADDLIQQRGLKAGDLVGQLGRMLGGGGGGRPTLASAGGRQPEKLDDALGAVASVLSDQL